MTVAISARNLGKRYHLYDKPIDRLKEMLTRGRRSYHREFWALRNVDFTLEQGHTVGVIGRNGSGKSTLLQLLAGTLQPSEGELRVNGRVSALLELGAGFNPEFTGRENVQLAGAIMGLSEREMASRFSAIEAFAEIGSFIEQPVKSYSSGMYVRLAFATAINVDPDILLVDEALAVGDAVFQYRCIQRIKDMQRQGVTIFFVSHDLSSIKTLCDHAMLIDCGALVTKGEPYDVIKRYQAIVMEAEEGLRPIEEADAAEFAGRFRHGNSDAVLLAARVTGPDGRPVEAVITGEPFGVKVRVGVSRPMNRPVVGIMLRNRMGLDMYGTNTELQGADLGMVEPGQEIEVSFGMTCWLGAGDYLVTAAVHTPDGVSCDWIDDATFFKVLGTKTAVGQVNCDASVEAIVRSADSEPAMRSPQSR